MALDFNPQLRIRVDRSLELVEVEEGDLPRALHDDGCCFRVPSTEEYREKLRQTYAWAGEEIPEELAEPAPDAPCFDFTENEIRGVLTEEWISYDDLRRLLGARRHTPKMRRPLGRLEERGEIVSAFDRGVREYRLAANREGKSCQGQ